MTQTNSSSNEHYPTDRPFRFGGNELRYVREAIESGNLFYWPEGRFVTRLIDHIRERFEMPYAVATSSGTSALQVALAAAGVRPGAEVIVPPITDMGTHIAVLRQNAIPVFADVHPHTYNLTPETIERAITDRTQVVLLVHLAGNPADAPAIADLCRRRGLLLIEDAAQAYGAYLHGEHVGTFGDFGCFSLNNSKHISCGEGGFVLTRDKRLYVRAHNHADKFYDRHNSGLWLQELGANFRMTELQGAVALAQMERMEAFTERRGLIGARLIEMLSDTPGILLPESLPGATCSYWFLMFRIDPTVVRVSREELQARLTERRVRCTAGYLHRPSYLEPMFQNKSFFPGGVWPGEVVAGRTYDYREVSCPVAEQVLETAMTLQVHEGQTDQEVQWIGTHVLKVWARAMQDANGVATEVGA